jgi:hypothetical protein
LADLQEELGSFNDMAITDGLFAELGDEFSQSGTAAAAITGWQAHASIGVEARLRNTWQDFRKIKAPWLRSAEA